MDAGYISFWVVFTLILGILYYFFIGSKGASVSQAFSRIAGNFKILISTQPSFVWIILSLILGTIAQFALFDAALGQEWNFNNNLVFVPSAPLVFVPGALLYAAAALMFVRGASSLPDNVLIVSTYSRFLRRPVFGLWLVSIGLAALIGLHAMYAARNESIGYAYSALWLASIVLFVTSILIETGWQSPSLQAMAGWLKNHRAELFIISTILVSSFVIRSLDLEAHPYSFHNDEGEIGLEGVCILQGQCTNWFATGWAAQTGLSFVPVALSIAIWGKTAIAVRIVSAIIGLLSTLAVYLFARELFTRRIAWLSAFMLATLPVHVHFSRQGVSNIVDSLSAPLLLWLFFRGIKRGSPLSFLAAGIVAGLCAYTYPGSLLAPALVVVLSLYFVLTTPGFLQAHARHMVIFIAIAVVIVLPIAGYYCTHPETFLARLQYENIWNTARQAEMGVSDQSSIEIITQQFMKSSLVFIATPASFGFFFSPRPYLTALAAILFVFGLAYTIRHIKNPVYLGLFIWFWAPVVLGSTLTSFPPASQRMLMSMPALAIITAIGATKTIATFQGWSKTIARFSSLVVLVIMLYIGYQDIHFYFQEYRAGHFFEDATNEFTYETRTEIIPLHDRGRLYIIQNPDAFFIASPNIRFFAPDVERLVFDPVRRETLAAIAPDKDVLFIAPRDRKSDLELIMDWVPGGVWNEVRRRYQPAETLYYSYKITKEQLQNFRP